MPYRKIPFINNEIYHVYNRGVASMPIFITNSDYARFVKTMVYYQNAGKKPKMSHYMEGKTKMDNRGKIVNVIAYCFMPNHFHLLLQQEKEHGISEFMGKIGNSYTKYFNAKNKRAGPILQGEFKAAHVETNEQLLYISRYIHLNPIVGFATRDLIDYPWSSYKEFMGLSNTNICSKDIVMSQFSSVFDYKQFILDREDYAKRFEIIRRKVLDKNGVHAAF